MNRKKLYGIIILAIVIIGIALFAHYFTPGILKNIKSAVPLPILTIIIATVDGFNPCNIFVLVLLLGFLLSASGTKFRIMLTGYTFIAVVFAFYFLFMAAWLNVFHLFGFINYLRIFIACFAIIVGLINCKELFLFKKGISLTIPESHKPMLYRKAHDLAANSDKVTTIGLMGAAAILASFSSLIELPCTAGFPIVFAGILVQKYPIHSWQNYLYLLFYNLIYVLPLIIIVTILSASLSRKQISKRQMQIIKFIGGIIMLLIGIILLVRPEILI